MRRLHHLREQRLGVAEHQRLQLAMPLEFRHERRHLDPVGKARVLDDGPAGGRFAAQKRDMPTRPSLPITAISAEPPSFMTYNSETMEVVGK
jgi:hypothetical protein